MWQSNPQIVRYFSFVSKQRIRKILLHRTTLFFVAVLLLATQARLVIGQQGEASDFNGVLLDFSATWCGPCQQVAPVVEQLERQGLPVKKIDVDQNRQLAQQFNIQGIPCFVLIVNGQEVQRLSGYQSEATLRALVARIPRKNAPQSQELQRLPEGTKFVNDGRTRPPQFPGQANSTERNAGAKSSQSGSTQNGQGAKGGFQIPFLGKSREPVSQNDSVVARAKIDELKLPHLDHPSPMASSTRICVTNRKNGSNLGSGTIISSEIGQTYVLTCGHVLRDYQPDSVIEVDFFVDKKERPITFVGKLVKHDLKADVGLISIPTETPLPVAPLAPADYVLKLRSDVLSIGCAGGETPSEQQIEVTRINRYSGPHNIECTGVPEQGRSGGGLFSPDGFVIGVCTAADKQDQRGIYAGYKAVHKLMDEVGLSRLYRSGSSSDETEGRQYTQGKDRQRGKTPSDEVASTGAAPEGSGNEASGPLQKLRNSLGELGDEEVVLLLPGTAASGSRRMMILRDSALTSQKRSKSVDDRDETLDNR